jgi:peroxiredoxin
MRAIYIWLAIAVAFAGGAAAQPAGEDQAKQDSKEARPLTDPFFLLVRDAQVGKQLAISGKQRTDLSAVLQKYNRFLLAIRDVGPQGVPEKAQPTLREVRSAVEEVLDDSQLARLDGLVLQAQGYDALVRPDVVADLKLSARQLQRLLMINDDFRAKAAGLQAAGEKKSAQSRDEELKRARREQHQSVLAVLEAPQRRRWAERLGDPFDFSSLRTGPALAPEFDGVSTWVNSAPQTMKELRGRVVVIHFFAFGCINCIHNYPWYREWQDAYDPNKVAIIGIHTPETQAERDVDQLRASVEKNQLKFAVAVDNDKKIWQAWSNSIWPSVYLIDKRGVVRYWWYGELDWQGAGGQHLARKRIDELLAEKVGGE